MGQTLTSPGGHKVKAIELTDVSQLGGAGATLILATTYTALVDGEVNVWAQNVGASKYIDINTEGQQFCKSYATSAGDAIYSIIIKKGQTWRVSTNGGASPVKIGFRPLS